MRPARPALGIDLGGTKIEAALLASDGSQTWHQRVATPAGDYGATVAVLAALVARARTAAAVPFSIGVGTPGAVAASGLMKNCNSTCLNGMPLQADLEIACGQPVVLANDANCLALSEATDGAGAGAAVVFAAILGTGAGAGIAVHGRVLQGPHRLAGEWGHNPLPSPTSGEVPAPACYCGRNGCIETWLSGPALARDAGRDDGDAGRVAAAGAAGDPGALAALDRYVDRLARALAHVINVVDPHAIVLGGGLSRLRHLYEQVPALWSPWIFGAGSDAVRTRLLPARHGDASGVRGAAWLGRAAGVEATAPLR